jgi:predicted permease
VTFATLLLRLYPASFRNEYGDEIRAVLEANLAAASGPLERARIRLAAIGDAIATAGRVHAELAGQDLRYAARSLARSPGFAATAIIVTALGIGANTAAFSVADFVLLRPLPYDHPEQLVQLWQAPRGCCLEPSAPNYRDWKVMTIAFSGMAASHPLDANLSGRGDPIRIEGAGVTADLLPLIGTRPALGRWFTAEEEARGATDRVIVSWALFQSTFGGDSTILGTTINLDGAPQVVIGVMPPAFGYPSRRTALWRLMDPQILRGDDRSDNWFSVLARVKPGTSVTGARADLSRVARILEERYPKDNAQMGAAVNPLAEEYSRQARALLIALCGASLCVLLIACANLANLLVARSLARRRELDVRTALGAGRERLVRQLLTESLVVAGAGGLLGVMIGVAAVPLLTQLVPSSLAVAAPPAVDLRVLALAALATTVTGLAFGVFPAVRAAGRADLSGLREGSRTSGGARARARAVLVTVEVAASVVLLVSAGLLMRALVRVQDTDLGFSAERLLTLQTAMPMARADTARVRLAFYRDVLTEVRALPGVQSAAYVSWLPLTMKGGIWGVTFGEADGARVPGQTASLRYVTPGYFETMGIRLRNGRDFRESDDAGAAKVVVVSESFVQRYFPGTDGLGRRFRFAFEEREVAGVVADVKVRGPERVSEPQVYLPYGQQGDATLTGYAPKDLVIRASVPPASLVAPVTRIVHAIDPAQPVTNARPMTAVVDAETASRAAQLRVIGAFAFIAIVLAAIGIHGLLAFTVHTRAHEIGVRMALGAGRGTIVRMVLRQGGLLAVAGVVPGVAVAYGAGRWMESLLAGVTPGDGVTFAVAAGVCALMVVAGSALPAIRAARVPLASVFRGD